MILPEKRMKFSFKLYALLQIKPSSMLVFVTELIPHTSHLSSFHDFVGMNFFQLGHFNSKF